MRVVGDRLIFSQDESPHLSTMFSQYLRGPGHDLPEPEALFLGEAWAKASDMSIMHILGGGEGAVTVMPANPGRALALSAEEIRQRHIVIPNEGNRIGGVIIWAAAELVPGSPAHTSIVGETLNSDYEDYPIPRILGSSNEGLAHERAESLLAAGRVAAQWAIQLGA